MNEALELACKTASAKFDADGLAGAVGQNDSAADLLVSVTAINAQTDVQLDGLVELGGSGLASQLQSLVHIVCLSRIDQLCSVDIVLAMFHCISPSSSPCTLTAPSASSPRLLRQLF